MPIDTLPHLRFVGGQGTSGVATAVPADVQLVRDPDYREIKSCQDASGDEFEAAFETLFRRYRHRVYSIAFRITGSASDAMDVTQEAFSLVFRKVQGFRFDSMFSTWLFRIVVNCSIDHRRKEHGRSALTSRTAASLGDEEPEDPSDGPVRHAESRELEAHLQASIQALSAKLSAILVLRYQEGMSYEELAETLQVSMGTIKSRLARAHMALERQLRGTLESFGIDSSSRREMQATTDEHEQSSAAGGAA